MWKQLSFAQNKFFDYQHVTDSKSIGQKKLLKKSISFSKEFSSLETQYFSTKLVGDSNHWAPLTRLITRLSRKQRKYLFIFFPNFKLDQRFKHLHKAWNQALCAFFPTLTFGDSRALLSWKKAINLHNVTTWDPFQFEILGRRPTPRSCVETRVLDVRFDWQGTTFVYEKALDLRYYMNTSQWLVCGAVSTDNALN